MSNKKEKVREITPMDEDFSQWYTDVILKTELVDYAPVKGFMVIRPYGYAIWENIQKEYDNRFKETGHKNMYFPLLIPESLLQKEKDHVEGFAPEVAWVTHGGDEELGERLCIRPTSETIICNMYSKWLTSWRELPYLYNQWCSVVRWEKSTRPFLRTSEFLWQEGHTLHETYEEAQAETLQMLDIYREVAENILAIPMVVGQKSEREKFAGAYATYTMEALMYDGKALQSGTSHNLGQHFTKAFDITYTDRNGEIAYPYHTSWGVSTRLIGALIMVHGDDNGLVLPPKVAPTQLVIIPVAQHKEGVLDKAYEIKKQLEKQFRVEMDDSESYSPGWKFNQWEMKGVPIRLEIGPRDIENNQVVAARRDNGEKVILSMDHLNEGIEKLLEEIQNSLYNKALKMREEKTYIAKNKQEFTKILETTPGFIKAMWCGDVECENKIKEDTGATLRCIPFEQEDLGTHHCICCGKEAKKMVYFAKAY
ncbi:proline--tRNA ligase [Garciella nitratireducens]|uniref:Proline--tRNA ligase n=1 Tax=Garciella nitratireducens DSM 15102 TaxID=1121911 RepID=A0A1T4NKV9_9FIRM|nr:proline--tRNA ligase [Garciella nitratireducens]SJZ79428.1 prolyl-tRNA synthetase [Garciella nitratireducens DSM 15102]